ncbi:alpha/beta fold hydrolase [Aureibaculum sp. 2210JD6-5]|uniref:alpha/beta hydrolase n=1 Tax=Aureibaculum sp. 2210JD6-5 TaxID=3103957 RepID=UPI002AAE6A96|nr:alpha/beta fold hydrolase [Aureibaculum sp. 2210JD6-5]MDY7396463.1 alpha/beta fold hydrolase [Aureibaculum sp. 2210JD6-5]
MKKIFKVLKWLAIVYIFITVLAYFFQEKLIFQPQVLPKDYTFQFDRNFEEVNLKTNDGEQINALHFKVEQPKGVVLYFHGNAGSLKGWGEVTRYFADLGYDAFVMDYRGYGKSTGSFNEDKMYADAQLCYDYLKKQYDEDYIIAYGKSLGTTFATKVAADNNPRQLILEVPFYNLAHAGKHRFPFAPIFLLNYKFMTNVYIKEVTCPITFFHGTDDWITPYDDSKKLFEEVEVKQKKFITIEGGSHNNLLQFDEYHLNLREILK